MIGRMWPLAESRDFLKQDTQATALEKNGRSSLAGVLTRRSILELAASTLKTRPYRQNCRIAAMVSGFSVPRIQ